MFFFNIWTSPDLTFRPVQIQKRTTPDIFFSKSGLVHILNMDLQKLYSEKRLNPDWNYLEWFLTS